MKILDLTNDSIEVHAREPKALRARLKDAQLEGIPEGFVEVIVDVGGDKLMLWFAPEQANKIQAAIDDKIRQCKALVFDPL